MAASDPQAPTSPGPARSPASPSPPAPAPAAGSAAAATPDAPTLAIPVRVELPQEEEEEEGPLAPRAGLTGRSAGTPALRRAAGRYIVEDEIGRGGMGVVYRAFDRDLRRHVAMKVMLHELGVERDLAERFVEEAQATAQLQHPGIVPVYEIGLNDDGKLFFTMKLVRGRTLARVIESVRQGDAGTAREFTRFRLLQVFVEVARAVFYAHERGVVHRDLKPQNVMIGRYGEVQVMDWGLAKVMARIGATEAGPSAPVPSGVTVADGRADTKVGSLVGTPAYMPPEQAEGDPRKVGPLADVYAIGATLYHILTGRAPFEGRSSDEVVAKLLTCDPAWPRALDPEVPRGLDAICRKAMAKEPGARYATAKALADDVQAYLEDLPVAAYPERLLDRAARFVKRHRTATAAAAIPLVLGLAGAVLAIVRIEGERRHAESERAAALAAREAERDARVAAEAERSRAEAERARAEEREREARRNLARVFFEKADRAWALRDAAAAEVLFAKALTLDDRRETRSRLHEARTRGARLVFTTPTRTKAYVVAWSPDGRWLASASSGGTVRFWDSEKGGELAPFEGSGDSIVLAASPDGRRLAAGDRDGKVRLLDVAARKETLALSGHEGSVAALAWSPDGRRLASGGNDGTIRIRDAGSGSELLVLRGHEDWVGGLSFAPDGRRLASASRDATVRVWDVESGSELAKLRPEGDEEGVIPEVSDVAFDPDGRRLAATVGKKVRVLDVGTGKEVRVLEGHTGVVRRVAFLGEGRVPGAPRLASAGDDGTVRIWDIEAGRPVDALESRGGGIRSIAPSPDGRRVATVAADRSLQVFDVETGKEVLASSGHGDEVLAVAVSPDGRRIASGSHDGSVRIWDAADGREVLAFFRDPTDLRSPVLGVAFGPADRLASWDWHGTLRILDVETGKEVLTARGPGGALRDVAFRADGRKVAWAEADQTVHIRDLETGKETVLARLPLIKGEGEPDVEGTVPCIAFAPDGRTLAATDSVGAVRHFDVETGELTGATPGVPLRSHGGHPASAVSLSPDRKRHVFQDEDQTIRLGDVVTGKDVLLLRGHGGSVRSVAWSSDGRWLALGGHGEISLFDLAAGGSGERALSLGGQPGAVSGLAFTPDGRRLVGGGDDGTVRLWELATAEVPLRPAEGGGEGPISADIPVSADGRYAAAGEGRVVRVWDAATGAQVRALDGGERSVEYIALRPDGRRLAGGGWAGPVRIFDVETGEQVRSLEGHRGVIQGLAFSADGRRLASAGYDMAADRDGGERVGDETRVWDVETGRELLALGMDVGAASCVALSPDGRRLAWGGRREVRLFDVESRKEVVPAALRAHEALVSGVAFRPDGRRLASAGDDGTVKLWAVEAGPGIEAVSVLGGGGGGPVTCVAWSGDGRRLAAGGDRGIVTLWDAEAGAEVLALRYPGAWTNALVFPRDGRELVVSDNTDRTVRRFDLDLVERVAGARPDELLAEAERRTGLRLDGLDVVPVPQNRLVPPGEAPR